MQKEYKDLFEDNTIGPNLKERVFKYLSNWPLILVALTICIGAGYFYAHYTPPKYIAHTSFLVKGEAGEGAKGQNDLIETALNGKREINLNNEIMVISSDNLMQRAVAKHSFNIDYFKQGKILKSDLYLDAPFRLVPKIISDSSFVRIELNNLQKSGGSLSYGSKNNEKKLLFKWGQAFVIEGKTFVLMPHGNIKNGDGNYEVTWQPVKSAAGELSSKLTVRPLDTRTSVISLSILVENMQKGKDVLNALFNEFNLADIEDRNKLSENTVRFIDERLNMTSEELRGVEGNLANYRSSNQLINVEEQSETAVNDANVASRSVKDLNVQQSVINMISGYFKNPGKGKLVPSSLGLNDPTLAALIAQYNEVELRREREAPLLAPNSLVMQDLNTQKESLKTSILESLNSLSKTLRLQEGNMRQQTGEYRQFLSSLPRNERVLQEIKRKQSITEGLYLYLLQKREEAAISSTSSSLSNYKQLDLAEAYGPVEPNSLKIISVSALLGLFLAMGIIYLRSVLNDKLDSQEDVTKHIRIPLLGQVSHVSKMKNTVIKVRERSLIGEQFRAIRTNLLFLLKDKSKKVILITSTVSGEGKSFISLNLAAVCAMLGKKIALLEFDIRKPVIHASLDMDNLIGLTSYLDGTVSDASEMYRNLDEIPGLHIYPAGPIPANPADLLSSDRMHCLIEHLKSQYDYVIIDSAPASLVSDPFLLAEYSDAVIYVLRAKKTSRKQLEYIDNLVKSKSLSNVKLILNDLKQEAMDKKYYDYYNQNGIHNLKKRKFSLIQ